MLLIRVIKVFIALNTGNSYSDLYCYNKMNCVLSNQLSHRCHGYKAFRKHCTIIQNCDICKVFVVFVCDPNMVHENPDKIPYVLGETCILFHVYIISLQFFSPKAIYIRRNFCYLFLELILNSQYSLEEGSIYTWIYLHVKSEVRN